MLTIDESPDESFLSIRADTLGRLFVGGREALFVYEPAKGGGYAPRQLLYRFPPDTWITDVAVRGDDLYVMTNAALYALEGGRTRRQGLVPRRLLWGSPVDLHVTWHGLAFGPEGDLYFSSGDPLLNYGDFQNRPDHWGHWTIYSAAGPPTPYTGMGGFFRCRPDGSGLQVVAGGTRGAVGIAFDRRWNLFSNDNDHESLADRYSPARLLHVAPRAHFFWPRGWIAGMSPERSDLLEIVNTGLGREAPVGQAYYDDGLLGPEYADSLLLARWGQRKVDGFRLAARGSSYRADEFPLLAGDETARPVGVAVGRGGRVFAALSYMAGNEWSPKYPSELVMITRAGDGPPYAFEAYDAPTADAGRLWSELSDPSWSRREAAHQEILRRGGELLVEAIARLKQSTSDDPAMTHLIWLAAASGRPQAREMLIALAGQANPAVRVQAVRACGEFHQLDAPGGLFTRALTDTDPAVQHAAIAALFDRDEPLGEESFAGPALSNDTYLRQASAFLIARRATSEQLARLLAASDAESRLAGVLAAGFRLTVPPAVGEVPAELPLRYESLNVLFTIQYADESVDLKKLGRVGSFTTAERWKAIRPSEAQRELVAALVARLDDDDPRVSEQAAYFLSLLDDKNLNPLVARSRRSVVLRSLEHAPETTIANVWQIGPFDDGDAGWATAHAVERGPIDVAQPRGQWRRVARVAASRRRAVRACGQPLRPNDVELSLFSLADARAAARGVERAANSAPKLWHNGRPLDGDGPLVLSLDPGSNDILVRVAHSEMASQVSLAVRAKARLEATLPEPLAAPSLAARLKSAGTSTSGSVGAEFASIDWARAVAGGSAERGRNCFRATHWAARSVMPWRPARKEAAPRRWPARRSGSRSATSSNRSWCRASKSPRSSAPPRLSPTKAARWPGWSWKKTTSASCCCWPMPRARRSPSVRSKSASCKVFRRCPAAWSKRLPS